MNIGIDTFNIWNHHVVAKICLAMYTPSQAHRTIVETLGKEDSKTRHIFRESVTPCGLRYLEKNSRILTTFIYTNYLPSNFRGDLRCLRYLRSLRCDGVIKRPLNRVLEQTMILNTPSYFRKTQEFWMYSDAENYYRRLYFKAWVSEI